MDRQKLVALAHADHPISAPVSDSKVDDLLGRTIRRPDAHVLDLGCGEGAWLLRALQAYPGITAVGVDISKERFDQTFESAARLGIADRLELIQQDVKQYRSSRPADVVLSIGAAYAFGELLPTLQAARAHLAEDGVLLLGDCFWEREPDPALLAENEDKGPQKFTDLPTLVDNVVADGWTPVFGHVSTPDGMGRLRVELDRRVGRMGPRPPRSSGPRTGSAGVRRTPPRLAPRPPRSTRVRLSPAAPVMVRFRASTRRATRSRRHS